MKHSRLIFLMLIIFNRPSAAQTPAPVLPDFKFFTFGGQPTGQRDLVKEKINLFIFFDPDCDHCQRTVADINKNYKAFSKASLIFVSVEGWQKINQFAGLYAPVLQKQKNVRFLRDSLNQFITIFKPRRYPALFLYSADKKLLDYEDNENSLFRIERFIKMAK